MNITRKGGLLAVRTSRLLTLLLLLCFLAPRPNAWTQYPGTPALEGATLGANLRNAAAATQAQLNVLRSATDSWCLQTDSAAYGAGHFQRDFANIQWYFQGLRTQFNSLGQLARQLGRPRADNAVAELDAGLNIIAELLTFLDEQSGGNLDRVTIARTARTFKSAMREWEREFRKNSSRIGLAW